MKEKILIFALLIIGLALHSCDNSDFEYEDSFNKSRKAWLDFKERSDNSYKYTTTGGSWTGYVWETSIIVLHGQIIERSFKYTSGRDIPENNRKWTESGNELNTHTSTPASEAVTLDIIYQKAQKDWLTKGKEAQTFFETSNNGMISVCGYVPNNCVDDCFRGINIASIQTMVIN